MTRFLSYPWIVLIWTAGLWSCGPDIHQTPDDSSDRTINAAAVDDHTGRRPRIPLVYADRGRHDRRGFSYSGFSADLEDGSGAWSPFRPGGPADCYPSSVLEEILDLVVVTPFLLNSGTRSGGIIVPNSKEMYIAVPDPLDRALWGRHDAVFHHELSSLLWRAHPAKFDEAAWREASAGFRYTHAYSVDAVREGRLGPVDWETLSAHGILWEYAGSTLEEDVNSYAEAMFGGMVETFWSAYDAAPSVRRKAGLLIDFYSALGIEVSIEQLRTKAEVRLGQGAGEEDHGQAGECQGRKDP